MLHQKRVIQLTRHLNMFADRWNSVIVKSNDVLLLEYFTQCKMELAYQVTFHTSCYTAKRSLNTRCYH